MLGSMFSGSVDSSAVSLESFCIIFSEKFPFLFCVFLPSEILIRCDLELVIVAFMNLNLSFTFSVSLPPVIWMHDFLSVLSSGLLICLCCVSFIV